MIPILLTDRVALLQGDSLELLDLLAPDSIDAVVTDPPAGIEFMGKAWDSFRALATPEQEAEFDRSRAAERGYQLDTNEWNERGNAFARSPTPRYKGKANADLFAFQDFIAAIFEKVFRVLKPGGHCLVWGIPRTSHHTAMGVERAGFEIRDRLSHLFGTGFPKSLNIGKAFTDAALGSALNVSADETGRLFQLAAQWDGWGSALKPACEDWILARKPLVGTLAHNVATLGTGGLNVDGCRIVGVKPLRENTTGAEGMFGLGSRLAVGETSQGRWPANLVLSHAPDCVSTGSRLVRANGSTTGAEPSSSSAKFHGNALPRLGWTAHGNGDGTETVEVYACVPGCPVRQLDEQSGRLRSTSQDASAAGGWWGASAESSNLPAGRTYGDAGGASRFFYVAKPGRRERDAGCEALPPRSGGEATAREDGSDGLKSPRAGAGRTGGARNYHPTVKSVELMRWLCRLITPPGGKVLDPFLGSGTTAVAALAEGFSVVGFERDDGYAQIVKARVEHALRGTQG